MVCCCIGTRTSCIFCQIQDSVGSRIVLETEHLVAFRDRSPSAKVHLLVIPKQHVRTVKDLDEGHVGLLQEMIELGQKLLKEQGYNPEDETQTRLGFHVPPFNSVDHLHLHVMGLPFHQSWKGLKYEQKYPWYVDARAVLRRLSEGMTPV